MKIVDQVADVAMATFFLDFQILSLNDFVLFKGDCVSRTLRIGFIFCVILLSLIRKTHIVCIRGFPYIVHVIN